MNEPKPIYSVIGVRHDNGKTWYVKRSQSMTNYPNVWSLLSIQFDPKIFTATNDISQVQLLMDKMSKERLGGVSIKVEKAINAGACMNNPMDTWVILFLYYVSFPDGEPILNPQYYSNSRWMTIEEYISLKNEANCQGLCTKLWTKAIHDYNIDNLEFEIPEHLQIKPY